MTHESIAKHPNLPARSSYNTWARSQQSYQCCVLHFLPLHQLAILAKISAGADMNISPHSRIVLSLPFLGISWACSRCKNIPRGLPTRKRLLVLKRKRSIVSEMTCLGSCDNRGILVGWLDKIWATRADPSFVKFSALLLARGSAVACL